MTVNKIIPEPVTLSDLGGIKKDAYPVENPETDLQATNWNATIANVASMSIMCPKAVCVVKPNGTSPTVDSYKAVWGSGIGSSPDVTHKSTGFYEIKFPATVSDALRDTGDSEYTNATHTVSLTWAVVTPSMGTSFIAATSEWADGVTLNVYTFDHNGSAKDIATGYITALVG